LHGNQIHLVLTSEVTDENASEYLADVDGILVPGGFGFRASEGKIRDMALLDLILQNVHLQDLIHFLKIQQLQVAFLNNLVSVQVKGKLVQLSMLEKTMYHSLVFV
jgi:hypothetical protein